MDRLTVKLLKWLDGKECLLESQVVGSGLSGALNRALVSGFADMSGHPTVKEPGSSVPAAAVLITAAGRRAISK